MLLSINLLKSLLLVLVDDMKKKILIIIAVVLALITAGLCFKYFVKPKIPPKVISLQEQGLPTDVNLIAHRGFSAVAPENSAEAFRKAGEYKFFAAECDIQLSKDGVWIVNHNSDIKKMTNGEGEISQMTYEELMQYTVDGGHHVKDFPNQKLITLDEYLEICNEYNIIPQIEVKSGNNTCLDKIITSLEKYEEMKKTAIIISFDAEILKKLQELDNTISYWYLSHEISDEAIKICTDNNFTLGFNCKEYDARMLKKAQENNINLASWTVDSTKIYKELYDLGVRNFTTNRLTK